MLTFDELVAKYMTLIEQAQDSGFRFGMAPLETIALQADRGEGADDGVARLIRALRVEIGAEIAPDKAVVAAAMLAKDLISRVELPEGHGATTEGLAPGGVTSNNPETEIDADEPAPEPVVVSVAAPTPDETEELQAATTKETNKALKGSYKKGGK